MSSIDLTKGSLGKHIKRIAIPSSVGFLFMTLFNVVDTIYTGFISTEAVAGISLSFPIFFMLISLGTGFSTGLTALISHSIGAKKPQKGWEYAYDAFKINLLIILITTILGVKVTPYIFRLMNASGAAYDYGVTYIVVILYGSFFFIINAFLRGILAAEGDTSSYRDFLIIGFFINIFLDYLFTIIFKWGTFGVAFATVVIQVFGGVYLIYKLKKSKLMKYFSVDVFKKEEKLYLEILKQGIPSSLNMMTIALGTFVINYFVTRHGGSQAMAAYGMAMRVEQLMLLPTIGINIAVLTIVGQNFGALNFERIHKVYSKSLAYGIFIMTFAMFIIFPFARYFMYIFSREKYVVEYGVQYLRIESFTFNTYVFLNVALAVLQGLKKPGFSLVIGIYRQFVLPVVIFYLFADVMGLGVKGVWYGILVINWSAVLITLRYLKVQLAKVEEGMYKS